MGFEQKKKKQISKNRKRSIPAFLIKAYEILEDTNNNLIISWTDRGDSFQVKDQFLFTNQILPIHFKHQNFSSFIRQLNMYGFNKSKCENQNEFFHKNFKRGMKELLLNIKRKPNDRKKVIKQDSDIKQVRITKTEQKIFKQNFNKVTQRAINNNDGKKNFLDKRSPVDSKLDFDIDFDLDLNLHHKNLNNFNNKKFKINNDFCEKNKILIFEENKLMENKLTSFKNIYQDYNSDNEKKIEQTINYIQAISRKLNLNNLLDAKVHDKHFSFLDKLDKINIFLQSLNKELLIKDKEKQISPTMSTKSYTLSQNTKSRVINDSEEIVSDTPSNNSKKIYLSYEDEFWDKNLILKNFLNTNMKIEYKVNTQKNITSFVCDIKKDTGSKNIEEIQLSPGRKNFDFATLNNLFKKNYKNQENSPCIVFPVRKQNLLS